MAAKGQRKTGGRKKGSRNKATAKREAEIAKSGKTPLQFLLGRMRSSKVDMGERIECAKAAAPYVHPKLAAIEHHGPDNGPIPFVMRMPAKEESSEKWEKQYRRK